MATCSGIKYGGLTDGGDTLTGDRNYTVVYLVQAASATEGIKSILLADGLPKYGDYYKTDSEADPQAFLTSRTPRLISTDLTTAYEVSCTFSTAASNGVASSISGGVLLPPVEPVNLAPELEWDFVETNVPVSRAYDEGWVAVNLFGGKAPVFQAGNGQLIPVINSAFDIYDTPVERELAHLVLRLTVNRGDYNPIVAAQYANVVNMDTWYGFPPKSALLKPIKARLVTEKGFAYWKWQVEMHFNFDLHIDNVLDAGMREFLDANYNKKEVQEGEDTGHRHIKNPNDKQLVTQPALLDGFGRALFPKQEKDTSLQVQVIQEFAARFKRYRKYDALPFGPLNLI